MKFREIQIDPGHVIDNSRVEVPLNGGKSLSVPFYVPPGTDHDAEVKSCVDSLAKCARDVGLDETLYEAVIFSLPDGRIAGFVLEPDEKVDLDLYTKSPAASGNPPDPAPTV